MNDKRFEEILEQVRNNIIKRLTEDEIKEKFKNLNLVNIQQIVRNYTDLHRAKAECKGCISPYDAFFTDKYIDIIKKSGKLERFDIGHIDMQINLGWSFNGLPHPIRKTCAYKPAYVEYVLSKYNKNNRYYDFSCGWGTRLLTSLAHNVYYYGTDPNDQLVPDLKRMAKDFEKYAGRDAHYEIRTQGSEVFVPEWENTMGLAFTSPPYFDLEDYKFGEQSIKVNPSYRGWINSYMRPTLNNIYKYLINDGYLVINISNSSAVEYDMEGTFIHNAELEGFKYLRTDKLYQTTRISKKGNKKDKYESFIILKKK